MRQPPVRVRLSARRSRGVGLLDAMIAMAILAFGLLAMTRFQSRTIAQTTEVQARSVAVRMADELLATAIVDTGNAACYTLPAAGVCGSVVARSRTTDWSTRVSAALPGTVTKTSTLDNGRLTIVLTWTGKESQEQRSLTAVTDVRP